MRVHIFYKYPRFVTGNEAKYILFLPPLNSTGKLRDYKSSPSVQHTLTSELSLQSSSLCLERATLCSPQSSKSIRSSGGAIGLVNDDMVRNKGKNAAATVKITFQTPSIGSGTRMDTDDADVSECE